MPEIQEERLPDSIVKSLLQITAGRGLTQREIEEISRMTGRQLYEQRFSHTFNRFPIHRILDFALGDVEFEWDSDLPPGFDYSIREAVRNLLIDGFLFERVDEDGIWWLEHVVKYEYFAKQLRFVKQQYPRDPVTHLIEIREYERPSTLTVMPADASEPVFEAHGALADACIMRQYWIKDEGDPVRIDERETLVKPWPIVESVFSTATGESYLEPVRYQLFRLEKIYKNIAENNDKHAVDRLFISGNIGDTEKLQRMMDMAEYRSSVVLPRDSKAEYPRVWDNGAMNNEERENIEAQVNAMLNIVDVIQTVISGVSRRLAMQPMNALAMRLRKIADEHMTEVSELVGVGYSLSFGSLEALDSNEKQIELAMLAAHREIIGDDTYREEVVRILEVSDPGVAANKAKLVEPASATAEKVSLEEKR